MKKIKLFEEFTNESFSTGSAKVRFKGISGLADERRLNMLKDAGFVKLGEDIVDTLGTTAAEMFSSGYFGITIHSQDGDKKWMIFDQPGVVGLEDQTMPYIQLKENGKEVMRFEPDYYKRPFGSVQMEPEMRKEAYEKILDYFKKMFA